MQTALHPPARAPQRFNPLHYPLCLTEPRYLSGTSAWEEHIPFAFACIGMLRPRVLVELGTQKGDSYCAFCQAVDMLQLATKCYAVDTWKGDEHAGFYDDSIFRELKAYHDPPYGSFSRLIRSTFDEALDHFPDGSVDLLHIDGLHTYEAVRHDFEAWLPKMSARGCILLHDTNVRERSFGVGKLWTELSRQYRAFEFVHGHGLGVLAVGSEPPQALVSLTSADQATTQSVRSVFFDLGKKAALIGETKRERARGELAAARAEIERLRTELAARRSEAGERADEIRRLRAALDASSAQAAKSTGKLNAIRKSVVWKIAKPTWKVEQWLGSRSSAYFRQHIKNSLRRSTPLIAPSARDDHYDCRHALPYVILPREYRNGTIVIIIPVYNAASDVQACLDSLVAHTSRSASILIIDDASTDPAIPPLLEGFSRIAGITVLRNERNLGYTRTVNKGINLAGRADVVLLNSDAFVTPRWLENLHLAAYSSNRIATVTPLSDNAGAFSVPEYGEANAPPACAHQDVYARMITQKSAMLRPSVPTGNGFCMYIRRSCIDEVGAFDEAAFPRGYGEENDFCMRALHKGWINIVDDRTIVYHRRSASFGEEKLKLMKQGAAVLDNRYPEYRILTRAFRGELMDTVRDRVRGLSVPSASNRAAGAPRVLFVVSIRTGGTPLTNSDLMGALGDYCQPWLFRCDSRALELSYVGREGIEPVAKHTLAEPIHVSTHVSDEYDRVVERWLVAYAIELVHIRHISWHSLNLTQICESLHIPVIFSFHDFYSVCPTVKLLDNERKFCGGICTTTPGSCTPGLWPKGTVPQLKNRWVRHWRSMMRRMLLHCDAFVTTAGSARDIILSAFPELGERDFRVVPHGRSFSRMLQCGRVPKEDRPIKILIPGHIDVAKGGEVIAEIVKRDRHGHFELHILGKLEKELQCLQTSRVVKHGPYGREEMMAKVAAIDPHLGAVFSIWAETHCHTLTELWACGLPVLAFDFGAVGERIRASGGGWLLPHDDHDALFDAICEIARDRHGFRRRIAEVHAWQSGEGRWNDVDQMAASYVDLYEQVLARRRVFAPQRQGIRVGIAVPADARTGEPAASSHIRILERAQNRPGRGIEFRRTSADRLMKLKEAAGPLDAVIVQRNAISPGKTDAVIAACRRNEVRIIIDLDDDLLAVPRDKDADGTYATSRESLIKLIRAAQCVTVSTEPLAERIEQYNTSVSILPNLVSDRLWFGPVGPVGDIPEEIAGRRDREIRIVYMGGFTHGEDLALLRAPMTELMQSNPLVRFFVIGGERQAAGWYTSLPIPHDRKAYPRFVPWARAIFAQMDFAVAPLVDNSFNAAKSDLKFLEYSAGGLAGVYSDVVPYRGIVADSGAGLLTANHASAWLEALRAFVVDRDRVGRVGRMARSWVKERRTLRTGLEEFDAMLRAIVSCKQTAEVAPRRGRKLLLDERRAGGLSQ